VFQNPTDDELALYLRATRTFALLAERSAEAEGLTLAQMRLLFTLFDIGVASCSAVASRLHVSVSSVTRLIARPAMTPLILRRVSPANASAIELALAAEGVATVHRVTEVRKKLLQAALADADPATAAGLRHVVDRLDEAIPS
jgi:DNA-binding MarR family transcriptional regulator